MKTKPIDPGMLDMAWKLLIAESGEGTDQDATLRVLNKLRLHLVKLVGATGFEALFNRSLTLAKNEVPWLKAVELKSNGAFEGLDDGSSLNQNSSEAARVGCVTLVAWILALLVTFIGEGLTLRLLSNVWPDISLTNIKSSERISNQKEKSSS